MRVPSPPPVYRVTITRTKKVALTPAYAVLLQALNTFLLVDFILFEFALWKEKEQVVLACRYFTVMVVPLYLVIALLSALVECLQLL